VCVTNKVSVCGTDVLRENAYCVCIFMHVLVRACVRLIACVAGREYVFGPNKFGQC